MKKIVTAVALILPAISWAHPGHGTTDGYSIKHYFTEPQHVIASMTVLAVSVLIVRFVKNRKKQQA